MTGPDDQILVEQALQGEPASFGTLCQRYYEALVATADSVLCDHHLAEDAAQEALAQACQRLATLRRPESFGPWVVAICRNVAKDMLRKLPRQQQAAVACLGPRPEPVSDDGEALLSGALVQLPPHLREVVFLRFFHGMNYRQMGSALGLTDKAIDGRLRRAKKRIAVYMTRRGFGNKELE